MTEIVVEVLPVDSAPQVGITVTVDSTAEIAVQWTVDSGATWVDVQGGQLTAVGGAFVRDHFPPLARPITYRVLVDGEDEVTASPVTVPSETWWLQNPLKPRDAAQLRPGIWPTAPGESVVLFGAAVAAGLDQSVDIAEVLGARLPVVSTGIRQAPSQVPFQIAHDIAVEGGALRRLLTESGQFVLRTTDTTVLDPVAYVVMPSLTEHQFQNGQVATFEGELRQSRSVSIQLVVPYFTYEQVRNLWDSLTYAGVYDARPGATYLDWLRDPTEGAP